MSPKGRRRRRVFDFNTEPLTTFHTDRSRVPAEHQWEHRELASPKVVTRKHNRRTLASRVLIRTLEHPANRHRKFRAVGHALRWQAAKRFTRRRHVLTKAYGMELLLPTASGSLSNLHYFGEAFEWELVRFVQRYLRDGDVVVDGGANVGMFTYACLDCLGSSGRVLAFEPIADYARYIAINAALNGAKANVVLFECALADEPGTGVMSADLDVSNHLHRTHGGSISRSSREVELVTLDSLQLRHLALLKLDLEGAELLALRGAAQAFGEGRIDVVAVEAHDGSLRKMGHDAQQVFDFLRGCGFDAYRYDPDNSELVQGRHVDHDTLWVNSSAVEAVRARLAEG